MVNILVKKMVSIVTAADCHFLWLLEYYQNECNTDDVRYKSYESCSRSLLRECFIWYQGE